jgi:hypothetical protein
MPWLLVGEFNEILFDSEKDGGLLRPQRYMQNFRDALEDCQLEDMAYIGDRFTWRRGSIRERLDRSICNREWNILFPLSGSVNEGITKSDHRPVLIDTVFYEGVEAPNPKFGSKIFEARWLNEPSVDEIVRGAWERAKESNQRLINTLADMHTDLHEWDREILKGLKKRIDRVENELQDLRRGPMTDEALVRQQEILVLLENLCEQEEVMWLQRGRANWLRKGDRNTNFFHHFASERNKKNMIKTLHTENGDIVEGINDLSNFIGGYFGELFMSDTGDPMQSVLDKVKHKVSQEMNEQLFISVYCGGS